MPRAFSRKPPVALTIAGVDSGGGAGIAADLKTFAMLGVHGACAVTALTAQNTQGVGQIHMVPAAHVVAQMEAVLDDLGCQAAKTGMLGTAEIVEAVALFVRHRGLANLVVDPVMVATSGALLLEAEAKDLYRDLLLPAARVITPNMAEAGALLERPVRTAEDMAAAARDLVEWGCEAAVVTGGHLPDEALDVVYDRKSRRARYLLGAKLPITSVHGSGCVFSAAVAAHLARGASVLTAVTKAKEFTTEAIRASLDLGAGAGPVNPMFSLTNQNKENQT